MDLQTFYEKYDKFSQPYEDYEELIEEIRESEYMIYDLEKVSLNNIDI